MDPKDFIYWLQGMLELSDAKSLNEAQTALIRAKLETCFQKVTSSSYFTYDGTAHPDNIAGVYKDMPLSTGVVQKFVDGVFQGYLVPDSSYLQEYTKSTLDLPKCGEAVAPLTC